MDASWEALGVPNDTPSLLRRLEAEWRALEDTIASCDTRTLERHAPGAWSIKDHLAHVSAWERYLCGHHLDGRPAHSVWELDEETYRKLDQDGINDLLYRRNLGRAWSEVQADLRCSHAEVLERLRAMPFARMQESRYPDEPDAGPLLAWVASNTYEHYREHREAIAPLANAAEAGRSE